MTEKMKARPVIFLFLLCLFNLALITEDAAAQRRFRFFYGKVIDKVTKQPIGNVNFSVRNSAVGTVSDSKGEYSFYLDTIPSILTVSHVGYETKKIILDTAAYKMTLYLVPAVTQLKEVIISATPQETIFRDEHYAVLDYEIDSGNIYLLVYRNRFSKSELICRTPGGDTIATSGLLPFTPVSLVRDCLGYLHVLSRDSAYQVYRKELVIRLIHPVTVKKYDEVLSDCIASTSEHLYFKRMTDNGLGTEFYTINRKNNSKKWIAQVRDEKKAKMLLRNVEDAWMLMNPSQPDQTAQKMSESKDVIKASRNATVDWYWVRKIIYPPIKSFLYRIGEFICIFNTPNKQMQFYDLAGNYSYKIELKTDHAGEGRWTNDILIDDVTLKVFTTYLKNGILNLYEIDLNTGQLTKILSTSHFFPQKLMISGNYLYYLYDDPISPDNKMLFRQRM
jgi:hypothetical protein